MAWDDGVADAAAGGGGGHQHRPARASWPSISKCFTEHGVNISQAKCRTTEDGRGINTFQVTVGHVDQLKTVLRSLTTIDGVVTATRL